MASCAEHVAVRADPLPLEPEPGAEARRPLEPEAVLQQERVGLDARRVAPCELARERIPRDRQVLLPELRCPLDRVVLFDVLDDRADLVLRVAESLQR